MAWHGTDYIYIFFFFLHDYINWPYEAVHPVVTFTCKSKMDVDGCGMREREGGWMDRCVKVERERDRR